MPEERVKGIRRGLAKYTDVNVAVRDGYLMTVPYVRKEQGNLAMPFFNSNAEPLTPEEPSVLFYELLNDGTFELAGVEWLVPTESTDSRPSLFGKSFDGPTPGETAFLPRHYGLHAWLFLENPDGLFAPTHPQLSPPSFIAQLDVLWERFGAFYTNPEKATSSGYRNTQKCIATDTGGYGVPYVNTTRAGTDLEHPPVLLYRLTSTWNYQLMGAEWYVSTDSVESPPTMFGQKFHEPTDGHSPRLEQGRHYGLHAWFFTANPNGMFAPYNPTVYC